MKHSRFVLQLGLFFASIAGGALAQSPVVQETLRQAQQMQAEGKWADADRSLNEALGTCQSDPDGRRCRIAVNFSLGFIADREADHDDINRTARLRAAETYYRQVLALSPSHAAALNNLTLVYGRLEESDKTEALLREAVAAGAGNDGEILTLLGNLYRSRGEWERALAEYERAADRLWRSEEPRRAIVGVYAALPATLLPELRKRAQEWEVRFPDVASEAYRVILDRDKEAPPALVDEVTVQWVQLLARTGQITQTAVAQLPAGPARTELQLFLENIAGKPAVDWWRAPPERASAVAAVALASGRARLAAGDAPGAVQRWELGQRIAPRYEEYAYEPRLHNRWIVRLDLQRELALAYAKFPELDPGRRKFRDLMYELVGGKMDMYRLGDLESIQRFHATLGLICAQANICDESGIMSTIFQLNRAVEVANRMEKDRGGAHQPLEDLKAILADALFKSGDKIRAGVTYLLAAEAALDEDRMLQARRHADRATELANGLSDSQRTWLSSIERIVITRLDIEAFHGDSVEASAAFLDAEGAYAWLNGAALPSLDQAFLVRQRFKALADLAMRLQRGEQRRSARALALKAFEVASNEVQSLIGFDDLERLDSVRRVALLPARVADGGVFVKSSAALSQPAGRAWRLYLPSEAPTTTAWVGNDLLLAFGARKIFAESWADPWIPFYVKRGDIMLFGSWIADSPNREKVILDLRALPDVQKVAFDPKVPSWATLDSPRR